MSFKYLRTEIDPESTSLPESGGNTREGSALVSFFTLPAKSDSSHFSRKWTPILLALIGLMPLSCKNGRPFARRHDVGYGPRTGQVVVETPAMLPTGVVRADVVMPGYVAGPVSSGVAPVPTSATVVTAQPTVVQAPSVAVNPAVHAPVTGSSFVPATNYSSSAYQPTPASNVAAAVSQDVATSQPRSYTTPGRYSRREAMPSQDMGNEPSSNANFRPNTQGFSDPAGTRRGTANTSNGGQAEEFLPPANSAATDPNARKEKKPASRSGFLDELSPPRG